MDLSKVRVLMYKEKILIIGSFITKAAEDALLPVATVCPLLIRS